MNENQQPDFPLTDSKAAKIKDTLRAVIIGIIGIATITILTLLLLQVNRIIFGSVQAEMVIIIQSIAVLFAGIIITISYTILTEREINEIDIRIPNKSDLYQIIFGLAGLIVVVITIGIIQNTIGIEQTSHSIIEQAETGVLNDRILLLLIPISILFIAPGEELIYRNVIQKTLYNNLSKSVSVLIASFIFAIVHAPAYLVSTTSTGNIYGSLLSLVTIFFLSVILGQIYAKTNNLSVPIICHGVYNGFIMVYSYSNIN